MASLMHRLEVSAGRRAYHSLNTLTRRVLGLTLHNTVIDGVNVPYWLGGSGPPVLLLHGFADRKETWVRVAPLLKQHHTIIAPDLPGYGQSGGIVANQATLPAQAALVRAFLDSLGYSRVHLVGNSMGGGVAIRLAADIPDRIRSLTLLGSMGPDTELTELRRRLEHGENILLPESIQQWEAMMDLLFVQRPLLPRQIRRYMAFEHIESRAKLHRQFGALIEPENYGLPKRWESISAPTLVVHGLSDHIIHPSTGRMLARLIGRAELMLLPDVGHAPQWEAPSQWIQAWRRLVAVA